MYEASVSSRNWRVGVFAIVDVFEDVVVFSLSFSLSLSLAFSCVRVARGRKCCKSLSDWAIRERERECMYVCMWVVHGKREKVTHGSMWDVSGGVFVSDGADLEGGKRSKIYCRTVSAGNEQRKTENYKTEGHKLVDTFISLLAAPYWSSCWCWCFLHC